LNVAQAERGLPEGEVRGQTQRLGQGAHFAGDMPYDWLETALYVTHSSRLTFIRFVMEP